VRGVAAARFGRRWLLVAAGALALAGAAPALDALPGLERGAADGAGAAGLRRRILAGAAQPWVGLAEATGRVALPELPALESTTALFTGVTRVRGFVAGPDRWRADELTPVGERDTYRADGSEYVWDFGFDQLTQLTGRPALRLPRAADLLPPELGRRLLGHVPDDPVGPLPARRIAGRSADGLRLVPQDPDTTVGRVDVWADRETGLPLRVEVAARAAAGRSLLVSELQDVDLRPPDPTVLTPPRPPGSGNVRAAANDLGGALRVLDAAAPPPRLAGRPRVTLTGDELPGVGVYGSGLAGFVLVPVSRGIAGRVLDGAGAAGGVPIAVPRGRAVRIATPLLSLAVRSGRGGGVLLVGPVGPDVLERAVVELSGART
jgi:MucB/RseB N-terminal domain